MKEYRKYKKGEKESRERVEISGDKKKKERGE